MSQKCSASGVNHQSEFKWQSDMTPHAFLSLNNEDEERTHNDGLYHHWRQTLPKSETREKSCDEDTSDEEADTGSEYDNTSDFFDEEAEEGEEEDTDDADDDVDDNDADLDGDVDEVADADDDNESLTENDQLYLPENLDQRLENVRKAWNRHKWPNEKRQIFTFARVGFRLQSARKKACEMDTDCQDGGVLNDWMTPVEGFGKLFFHVIGTEKRSSLNSKSTNDQSYNNSDTGQTLESSHSKGKKAVKGLGSKFNSLSVK